MDILLFPAITVADHTSFSNHKLLNDIKNLQLHVISFLALC